MHAFECKQNQFFFHSFRPRSHCRYPVSIEINCFFLFFLLEFIAVSTLRVSLLMTLGGNSLKESFENAALGVLNYMTPLEAVEGKESREINLEARDLKALLVKFLDEFVYLMSGENFICAKVRVKELAEKDSASGNWKICASVAGECWNRQKHQGGTEVKAITYSNLSICSEEAPFDIFVIIDI